MRQRWWPALDGVRGIAVAAVVIYHLDKDWLPGGYLGVSLFFTLSGFLIIGGLVEERTRTGAVDLRRFWTRRARRLLPAAALTIVATVITVAIRFPDELERIGLDGLAGLANVANWRDIVAVVDYSLRFGGVEPLGHLWSLSIEEQLYIVIPLAVAVLGVRRSAFAALAVVVVGLAVFWGTSDAYLATPVRLGEVALGGLLGARVYRSGTAPAWLVALAKPAAVLGIGAFVVLSDSTPVIFTFGLPLVGLIWVGVLAGAVSPGGLSRALSIPPLRWLGQRSYAIYLFHVPLIELTTWSAPVVVVVTLVLADLSLRLVELPVRRGSVPVKRVVAVTIAAAIAVVAMPVAFAPSQADLVAAVEVSIAALPPLEAAEVEVVPETTIAHADAIEVVVTSPPTTTPVRPEGWTPTVLTIGDSTMAKLDEPLEAWLSNTEGTLERRSFPGCSPLSSDPAPLELRFDETPEGFIGAGVCRASVGDVITEIGTVDLVIIVDHGMVMVDYRWVGDSVWSSIADQAVSDELRSRYQLWIDEAAALGAKTLLATAPLIEPGSTAAERQAADAVERTAAHNEIVFALADANPETVIVVDYADAVEQDPQRYERTDGVHFRPESGGVAVVIDFLGPAIEEALGLS